LTPHVVPTGAGESAVQLSATKLAARAKDLETLIGVVVDAAAVGASLWLSYIFVLFYLALALGGVTHRELL
jgi:hypothetical protein